VFQAKCGPATSKRSNGLSASEEASESSVHIAIAPLIKADGNKSLYLVFVGVVFSQHLRLLLEQLGQHLGLLLEQLGQ
jgi:hypothetical protein